MRKCTILGAIAGDVIGSVYEFNPTKKHDFELFREGMSPTDDSIMTLAVAEWILTGGNYRTLVEIMRKWGARYPYPTGGYGGRFSQWLFMDYPQPYNSWGNGSAMRVSAVGFAFPTLEETLRTAEISASVTHNHPEGIKGAQATAAAIFLARNGSDKEEIRKYTEDNFGYDLHRTCSDIRPSYRFEESCQETVPQSLIAFLDSKDYEDAVRLAISMGGDADTMGAITGGVAAAYYGGLPENIYDFVMNSLSEDMLQLIGKFEAGYGKI